MPAGAKSGHVLLLLSCSHRKRPDGLAPPSTAPRVSECLTFSRAKFLGCRRSVFDLLKGTRSRLYDREQRGGYRDEHGPNRKLRGDQEFDLEKDPRALYLPANQRYAGRFFERLDEENPKFWNGLLQTPIEILFVSALYGLLLWNEPIQDYDCHASDRIADANLMVGDIWRPVATDALLDFISRGGRNPEHERFAAIFDLLSENAYQNMFDWTRIESTMLGREPRLYHRIFLRCEGPDVLFHLAKVCGKQLPRFLPSDPQHFEAGPWYSVPDADRFPKFGFETKIGSKTEATREGEVASALRSMLNQNERLKLVRDEGALRQLALAEVSWKKVRDASAFDFGSIALAYAKSAEAFFRRALRDCPPRASLGAIARLASADRRWLSMKNDLEKLAGIRDRGAHPRGMPVGKPEVDFARRTVIRAMETSVQPLGR